MRGRPCRKNRAKYSGILPDQDHGHRWAREQSPGGDADRYGEYRWSSNKNVRYNNLYQIIQTDEYVVLHIEMAHDENNSNNITTSTKKIEPWFGDSVGRWAGQTLIVETVGLHPLHAERHYVAALSERARVIEKFTRISEAEMLYEFAEDPIYYTENWSGEMIFTASEEPIYEYACHEGNYGLTGILAGARQIDQESQ